MKLFIKRHKKAIIIITILIIVSIIAAIISYNVLNKVDKIKIEMDCNGNKKVYEVNTGSKIKCELLEEKYIFTIKQTGKEKTIIEANIYGLTSSGSLLDRNKKWTLYSDEELTLHTQTTDYQEKAIFKYIK